MCVSSVLLVHLRVGAQCLHISLCDVCCVHACVGAVYLSLSHSLRARFGGLLGVWSWRGHHCAVCCTTEPRGPVAASPALPPHLEVRKERHCLIHHGSRNTRQGQCRTVLKHLQAIIRIRVECVIDGVDFGPRHHCCWIRCHLQLKGNSGQQR